MNSATNDFSPGQRFGRVLTLISLAYAAIVLWSWGAGVGYLCSFGAGQFPTAPSTAIGLAGFGLVLFLTRPWPGFVFGMHWGKVVMTLLSGGGVLAMLRAWFGWGSPVERWLAQSNDQLGNMPVGLMSSLTGALFLVAGVTYWLQATAGKKQSVRWRAGQVLAVGIMVASAGMLAGYAGKRPWIYGAAGVPVSLGTAGAFYLLGCALFCNAAGFLHPLPVEAPAGSRLVPDPGFNPVWIVITFVFAISTLTAVYHRHVQAQDRKDARGLLDAVGKLKTAQILDWRNERLNDARFFAQADFVARDVFDLLEHPNSNFVRHQLRSLLEGLKGGERFAAVAFFDTNGVMRLGLPAAGSASLMARPALLTEAFRRRQVIMSDLYRTSEGDRVFLDIVLPIMEPEPTAGPLGPRVEPPLIGGILLRLDPHQALFPLVTAWPTRSRTSEAMLYRRNGNQLVCLTQRRLPTNAPIRFATEPVLNSSQPAITDFPLRLGLTEGPDYRGVPVFADICQIPDSDWFLLVKIDREEVCRTLYHQAWLTLLLTLMLALASGTALGFVSKRRDARRALAVLKVEQERHALAQRVEHLMRYANDAILLADQDFHIVEANDRLLKTYDYSLAQIRAMSIVDLRAPEARDGFAEDYQRLQTSRQAVFETLHQRRDGSIFPVEVSSNLVEIDGSLFKLAIIRDISERKAQEREISRLARLYDTLSQVNQCIVRVRSREELFAEICRITVDHAGFKVVWIGWRVPGTEAIEILAQAGERAGYLDEIKLSAADVPEGRGPVGNCLRDGRSVIFRDFLGDPASTPWYEAASRYQLRAAASLPIRSEGELWGVLTVYADEAGIFLEKEVELLEEMALDISFALDHLIQEDRRRRAEETLLASTAKLEAALASMTDAVFICDTAGRILEINDAFATFYKFGNQQACSRTLAEYPNFLEVRLGNGEIAPLEKWAVPRALAGEVVRNAEFILRRKDTGESWVGSYSFAPIRDANGGIVGSVCIARDITEQKQAEAALRASEETFRAMFELASIGMAQSDPHTGRLLRVNQKLAAMTGYSIAELLEICFPAITHPDDRQADWEQFQRVVRGETADYHMEKRYLRKNGSIAWANVNVTMIRDARGEPRHSMATIEDITPRKEAESRIRRLVDSNLQGVVFWKSNGKITGANTAFLQMLGLGRAELEAGLLDWGQLTPGEFAGADSQARGELVAKGVCTPYEKAFLHADGTPVPVLVGAAAIETSPDEGVSFVIDLSERKKLEQKFLRAQRMESIGTLAGGIAHDLNNMLTPILMSIPMLKDLAQCDADLELLATLQNCTERGAALVKQVLSFARGVGGERVMVNPLHLMRDLVEVMLDTMPKSINLNFTSDRELWMVTGDPTQIHQVFMNLCVNARDAMPGGGNLVIHLQNVMLDEVFTAMNPEAHPGPYVLVRIEDTGEGIPPEFQQRIFEPFFTTKEIGKGTGLGLSTTLGIVRSHNGFITFTSEVRQGTKFRVYLPANLGEATTKKLDLVQAQLPRGGGKLILVVDDDEAILRVAKGTLERFDYRVLVARNGAEAMGLYAQHRAEVAVVLTDMAMPIMDGPALVFALKSMNQRVRIIGSSGLTSHSLATQAHKVGVQLFLPKPYTAEMLLQALQQVYHC